MEKTSISHLKSMIVSKYSLAPNSSLALTPKLTLTLALPLALALALLTAFNLSAQNNWFSAHGKYKACSVPINRDSIDSVRNLYPVRRVYPVFFIEFKPSQTLYLKWNGRFKITDNGPIPAIGLNTDHPTIYGRYSIKNDTLILKYRYTIQHFNKLAEKRRVKHKFKQKNRPAPIKRFARKKKNEFKISQYHYWKRMK